MSKQFLSDLVLNRTYAATKPDGSKEDWSEVVERVISQHVRKFPNLEKEIRDAVENPLLNKQVVPSMRSLQFAGPAIEKEHLRNFNCAFTTIEKFQDLAEIAYLSACGCGVGFSVQKRHVEHLPVVTEGTPELFIILDSRESWADSFKELCLNPKIEFNYSLIRAKGAPLSTGGTASGPEVLQLAHERMRKILVGAVGRKLRPIEVHDMICQIADCIVAGGVRRSALISLFDWNDEEMLQAKQGNWWETAPWRGRSNNSALVHRNDPAKKYAFDKVMQACFDSNSGEPGLVLSNDYDMGINPCCEISLRSKQTCNLSEVNLAALVNRDEVKQAAYAAAVLGTLQASYTDFGYVSGQWKFNCDDEALLGVSLTGQAQRWPWLSQPGFLRELARTVKEANIEWARKLEINPAARITCTKPSGSASAFLSTTSGIHAAHAPYFIRRVRLENGGPLASYLKANLPAIFLETDIFDKDKLVVSIPMEMQGIQREDESAEELLERMKWVSSQWIEPGHVSGANKHNISLTVSYKKEEESGVKQWMWDNQESYTGISLLPFDNSSYVQMPFEAITKDKYEELVAQFPTLDLAKVSYLGETDERQGEAACSNGNCEWGK